jgi:hypothetical protein
VWESWRGDIRTRRFRYWNHRLGFDFWNFPVLNAEMRMRHSCVLLTKRLRGSGKLNNIRYYENMNSYCIKNCCREFLISPCASTKCPRTFYSCSKASQTWKEWLPSSLFRAWNVPRRSRAFLRSQLFNFPAWEIPGKFAFYYVVSKSTSSHNLHDKQTVKFHLIITLS